MTQQSDTQGPFLYFMSDGTIYYSETGCSVLGEFGEVLRLNAEKTLMIKLEYDNRQQITGFQASKLDMALGKPEYIERPVKFIAAMQKCGDETFITKCRTALAGIIIARPGDLNDQRN